VTDRPWTVKLSGPARRALETGLPEAVAWAAYTFITERLPLNPHRLGGELDGPYAGMRSAHLGTYRVIYRIVEDQHTVIVLAIRLRGDVYGVR
jgi:mRNA interferase RelE/StbE